LTMRLLAPSLRSASGCSRLANRRDLSGLRLRPAAAAVPVSGPPHSSSNRAEIKTKFSSSMTRVVAVAFATSAIQSLRRAVAEDDVKDELDPAVSDILKADIVLYQFETCPFCHKVRAFLDFHNIPYRVVEVNPLWKTELKQVSDYNKVPLMKINGKEVRDSDRIIDTLHGYLLRQNQDTPFTDKEKQWRAYVNDILLRLFTANVYQTLNDSFQMMDYISKSSNFSAFGKLSAYWAGSIAMYMLGRKRRKQLGSDPRQALYGEVNKVVESLRTSGKPFLNGDKPGDADVFVFAMFRALEPLRVFADIKAICAIMPWFLRVKEAVGPSKRIS